MQIMLTSKMASAFCSNGNGCSCRLMVSSQGRTACGIPASPQRRHEQPGDLAHAALSPEVAHDIDTGLKSVAVRLEPAWVRPRL